MALPSNPDIIQNHDEYNRLLRDYQATKEAYQVDDSKENWDNLQEALIRLKRHNDKRDR